MLKKNYDGHSTGGLGYYQAIMPVKQCQYSFMKHVLDVNDRISKTHLIRSAIASWFSSSIIMVPKQIDHKVKVSLHKSQSYINSNNNSSLFHLKL